MSHKQPSCWGDAAKHANRSQFKAPGVYRGALWHRSEPIVSDGCREPADTAGWLVRLRETSAVCMRLEEEGEENEEAEDGTPLMLMRERSVADQRRWTGCQTMERRGLILWSAALVMDSDGDAATDGFFEARPTEGFDERTTVSCRHSPGLSCYWHWHRWIAAGINRAENQT